MILTTGCSATLVTIGNIIGGGMTVTGGYLNKEAATLEREAAEIYKQVAEERKVEIDQVISKDCLLYRYHQVDNTTRINLSKTPGGRKVLENIAKRNKIMVEKCPNIEKPK